MADIYRTFPVEDMRILSRAQGSEYSDGRTVEAYAAVFDVEAEIQDGQGHYLETIDRNAFNRAIDHARPQGGRDSWRTKVFYNHGMTIHGTPAESFSKTLGATIDLKADGRGLLTRTRYNNTPLAEEILEAIRNGDITGQSFSGRIVRSTPIRPPRGGFRASAGGKLPVVRRTELGLTEYGPTPMPAYETADIVGIRNRTAEDILTAVLAPEDLLALISRLSATRLDDDSADIDTSDDQSDLVPDDSPSEEEEHSSRDALRQRIAAIRSQRPDLFPAD